MSLIAYSSFTDRDVQHNISNSEFLNNRDGAISYQSVGEVNPLVAITRNEVTGNCLKLYGNFTTCQSAVRVDVQNTQTLVFRVGVFTVNYYVVVAELYAFGVYKYICICFRTISYATTLAGYP